MTLSGNFQGSSQHTMEKRNLTGNIFCCLPPMIGYGIAGIGLKADGPYCHTYRTCHRQLPSDAWQQKTGSIHTMYTTCLSHSKYKTDLCGYVSDQFSKIHHLHIFREHHPHPRAHSGFAPQSDLRAVLCHDMFYDRKSQTGAARGFGTAFIHAVKALKYTLLMFF